MNVSVNIVTYVYKNVNRHKIEKNKNIQKEFKNIKRLLNKIQYLT